MSSFVVRYVTLSFFHWGYCLLLAVQKFTVNSGNHSRFGNLSIYGYKLIGITKFLKVDRRLGTGFSIELRVQTRLLLWGRSKISAQINHCRVVDFSPNRFFIIIIIIIIQFIYIALLILIIHSALQF